MTSSSRHKRVLALDARPRSFGYALFEGPGRLLEWGARSFRKGANAVRVPVGKKIAALFDEVTPSVVVLNKRASERAARKSRISSAIVKEAKAQRIPVRLVSNRAVRVAFAGHAKNKDEIASAVAERFPYLACHLPPRRKPWQSEDYQISIFDAVALGITYLRPKASLQESTGTESVKPFQSA